MTTFIPFGDTAALSKLDARFHAGEIAGVVLTPMDGHYKAEYVVLTPPPLPKEQPEPEMNPRAVSEPANPCPEPVYRIRLCKVCDYPLEPQEQCPICASRARMQANFRERHGSTLAESQQQEHERREPMSDP